jgi:hypothetical protein
MIDTTERVTRSRNPDLESVSKRCKADISRLLMRPSSHCARPLLSMVRSANFLEHSILAQSAALQCLVPHGSSLSQGVLASLRRSKVNCKHSDAGVDVDSPTIFLSQKIINHCDALPGRPG